MGQKDVKSKQDDELIASDILETFKEITAFKDITTFKKQISKYWNEWFRFKEFTDYVNRESKNIIYNNLIFDFFMGITSLVFMILNHSKLLFLVHGGVIAGIVVSAFLANLNNRYAISWVVDLYQGEQPKKRHIIAYKLTAILSELLTVFTIILFIYSLTLEYQQFTL